MKPYWHRIVRHLAFLLSCSWIVPAQADVHRFDPSPILIAPAALPNDSLEESAPSVNTRSAHDTLHQLTDKELKNYPLVMAQVIEQAIKTRQLEVLRHLLIAYQANPLADPYLILYAQGSLYRYDKDYRLAIGAFNALLYLKPELTYIRFDLAMMQIEDKRYGDAMGNLEHVRNDSGVSQQTRNLAEAYLKHLRQLQALDIILSSSLIRNDNVNQASAERTLDLWGMRFRKHEDSLPKEGNGIAYGMGLKQLVPLQGNHGLSFTMQYNGTHYWDQKDYSEGTLRLNPAYLYQDHAQWFKAGPVYEKNWLGSREYGTRLGIQTEWGKQIQPRHYLIPYVEYTNKRYASMHLARYEGESYRTGVTWFYQASPGTSLSMGGHYQRDALYDKVESSSTLSVRLGGSYRAENGLNTQISLHLGERDFEAPHTLFGYTRKDNERMASIGLWHSKVSFMSITPKLVYRYSDINSNISALYSRKSRGFMLEVVEIKF